MNWTEYNIQIKYQTMKSAKSDEMAKTDSVEDRITELLSEDAFVIWREKLFYIQVSSLWANEYLVNVIEST